MFGEEHQRIDALRIRDKKRRKKEGEKPIERQGKGHSKLTTPKMRARTAEMTTKVARP